jgi:hypothetical protein
MKTVTVYHTITVFRVDYVKKMKRPIGTVKERRQTSRPDNLSGLLQLARKTFSTSPQEAFQIALDTSSLRLR